jgi:hypothetical protein
VALFQKPEVCGKDEVSQPSLHVERHPSTSFVDSIMVAITTDLAQVNDTQPQAEGLGSETSAFTRLAPITPKKCQGEASIASPQGVSGFCSAGTL